MNKLTIYGENNSNKMGPSCNGLFIDKLNYNILFDCGSAISNKIPEKFIENLENMCSSALNYNIPEELKSHLESALKEIQKDNEPLSEFDTGELISPRLSLLQNKKVDCLIASHGHLDHIGSALRLNEHFKKNAKVFGSPYTFELMSYQLNDMMNHQAKKNFGLFDIYDLEERFKPISLGEQEILPGLKIFAVHSGHIHGSVSVIIKLPNGKNAMFLTDTAFHNQVLLEGAKLLSQVIPKNWIPDIILSTDLTYGFKDQKNYEKELQKLKNKVIKTVSRNGKALIPSFMLIRGHSAAITLTKELKKRNIPLYVDGGVRGVFPIIENKYWSDYEKDFSMDGINFVKPYDRKGGRDYRQELLDSRGPLVIVSTSGMGDFGPVGGKYLFPFLSSEKNSVIFTGYQAPGTIGHALTHANVNGSGKFFSLNGKLINFKADVDKVDLSAHSGIDKFCNFFEDIVEMREGKKMEFCNLTHGEHDKKENAKKLFALYFEKIYIAETGEIIEF